MNHFICSRGWKGREFNRAAAELAECRRALSPAVVSEEEQVRRQAGGRSLVGDRRSRWRVDHQSTRGSSEGERLRRKPENGGRRGVVAYTDSKECHGIPGSRSTM